MKILSLVCGLLLGLMFTVFGANIIHPFLKMPLPPAGSHPAVFFDLFFSTGWMRVIGEFELMGGLMLLFGLVGRSTPIGLIVLAPVLVNIWCFHMLLTGGVGIAAGVVATVLWLILAYAFRKSFAGLFAPRSAYFG
jgi:putative oxidoreductase